MKGIPLKERIRMAARGVGGVMRQPIYVTLALVLAFLFGTLIYLIINWGVYGSLLLSSLGFFDKVSTLGLMVQRLGESIMTGNGILLLVVSILQGISLALIVYTVKRNKMNSSATASIGGSGFAAIAAALGLGCVPCGTSIILPVMTLFFSGSAYAAAEVASVIVLVLALIATIYSIYRLGFVASAYTEQDMIKKGAS